MTSPSIWRRVEQEAFTFLYWVRDLAGRDRLSISQINDQLWCSAALTSEADVGQIVTLRITAVIDCRLEFDDRSLIRRYDHAPPSPVVALKRAFGLDYCDDGVADDGRAKPVEWFEKGWDFARPRLESGAVVLTHCSAGVNRGPSLAYFLLRAYWDMSPSDALDLIIARRPVAKVRYHEDADRAITALGLC